MKKTIKSSSVSLMQAFPMKSWMLPAAGATGGTVIRGRGTANREAEDFFHIQFQPDKEIIMILVPEEIREAVLHALYRGVGLDTPGQGIAFCLPVDEVVGLPDAEKKQD